MRLKDWDQQGDGEIWMKNSRYSFCVVSCMGQIWTALADLSPSERMNMMYWVLLLDLLYHCYLFVAANKCDSFSAHTYKSRLWQRIDGCTCRCLHSHLSSCLVNVWAQMQTKMLSWQLLKVYWASLAIIIQASCGNQPASSNQHKNCVPMLLACTSYVKALLTCVTILQCYFNKQNNKLSPTSRLTHITKQIGWSMSKTCWEELIKVGWPCWFCIYIYFFFIPKVLLHTNNWFNSRDCRVQSCCFYCLSCKYYYLTASMWK